LGLKTIINTSSWLKVRPENVKEEPEFVSLACQGMDIVFRFIVEYSSLKDFGP
jgi:hypothetical protein